MSQRLQRLLYLTSFLVLAMLILELGPLLRPRLPSSRQVESAARLLGLNAASEEDAGILESGQRRRGYVVIFRFMSVSQQAVGLRSFVSAQCWVGSFNLPMYIVQPFIEDSVVHTLPRKSSRVLTMSNFIDMEHYKSETRREGWGQVVSWTDFLQNAPRNIIYVQTRHVKNCRCMYETKSTKEVEWVPPVVSWSANDTRCLHFRNNGPLLSLAGSRGQFCVVRVVTVHPNPHVCNATEMHATLFGDWKPQEVTLIFQQWCPGMYIPNPALSDPAICRKACDEGLEHKFLPSQQLLHHAEAYEALHSEDGRPFKVAAMLRSEHVLLSVNRTSWNRSLQTCLSYGSSLLSFLQSKTGTRETFLTADIGSYGSNNWKALLESHDDKHIIIQRIKGTIVHWYNYTVTFKEWEDSFTNITGGLADRGYIATLQRTIASRADCLVLLGGGNFLRLALHDYLNRHPESRTWCLHFVCLDSRFRDEYHDILRSYGGHTSWRLIDTDIPLYVGRLDN